MICLLQLRDVCTETRKQDKAVGVTTKASTPDVKALTGWVKKLKFGGRRDEDKSDELTPSVNIKKDICRLEVQEKLPKLRLGTPCCLAPQSSIDIEL